MDADRSDESATRPGARPAAATEPALGVAIVSIVGARTDGEDRPLAALVELVEAGGHEVAIRERIEPDFDTVQAVVSRLADRDDVDALLSIGGLGIGSEDVTVEAVRQLLDAELLAFETLFTTRVAEAIGVDVLAVRPLGGVIAGVPVFCLPDDERMARLAMEGIVCPQLTRVVSLAGPDEPRADESESNE